MKVKTKRKSWLIIVFILPLFYLLFLGKSEAKTLSFEVIDRFPHDPSAFTQGLVFRGDRLIEGTGGYNTSDIRLVMPETGHVIRRQSLPSDEFGEGVTLINGEVFQLTWKKGKAYVYDARTLGIKRTLQYEGEGWGLTHNGTELVMSDGSDHVTFRDPETFKVIKTLNVTLNGKPLKSLNELEFVDGAIWANVWQTPNLVKIDPQTGVVLALLDCRGLLPFTERTGREDVQNGIAYRGEPGILYVTGKNWPHLYKIRVLSEEE